MAIGIDVGTFTLIKASRNKDDKIDYTKEMNVFLEVPLENRFTFNMMKKAGVPLIERANMAYAVGEKAIDIAYSYNTELRRPMKDGCVNPAEKDGFQILSVMLHSLIGEVEKDGDVLCYSVPGSTINIETDAAYHAEILKQIFNKYEINGKKVVPYAVNEALALVYAELQHKFLTGIGISCGAGQVNVCFANRSVPVFQFALVNSGDWIDKQAAKALGESTTFVNKAKLKIDLTKAPMNDVERAIQTQYRLMIRNTVKGIKEAFENPKAKVRLDDTVDIVLAGGTSGPNGFEAVFKETIKEIGLPITIGVIKKPTDFLYAVARGCLLAAEAAE